MTSERIVTEELREAEVEVVSPVSGRRYAIKFQWVDREYEAVVWRRLPENTCDWCGGPIVGRRRHARFCSVAHQRIYNNRLLTERRKLARRKLARGL
jgi:hypothetical protein